MVDNDMKKEWGLIKGRPTSEQFGRELRRRELAAEARKAIIKAIKTLIVFAAVAVLLVTLLFPTIQVQRGSMAPTLRDGEQIILLTVGSIGRGDIVAFHHGNQTLIKRVIAVAGERVDIDASGAVYVDGTLLDEPYLSDRSHGGFDVEYPFQVPDKQYFVMGDNRAVSIDSRSLVFGTIHQDEIVGKAICRIWPFARIGFVR